MMRQDLLCIAAAAAVSTMAMGCATSSGALDQADIRGTCDDDDAGCVADGLDAALAVGTRMTLTLGSQSSGTALPSLAVESAREEVIAVDGMTLSAASEGMSALLFITEDGRAFDFVHMSTRVPDRLALIPLGDLQGYGPIEGAVQMLVGDELAVLPRLFLGDERLIGDAEVSLDVVGEAVTVLEEGLGARRRIVAREVGEATATFTMAGLTTTVEMEVLP